MSSYTQVLVEKGLVTVEDIDTAERLRDDQGLRLDQALIQNGALSEQDFLKVMGERLDFEIVDLPNATIEDEAIRSLPSRFVYRNHLAPIARENGMLKVATSDPFDLYVFDEIKLLTGLQVSPVLAPRDEIDKVIKDHYGVGGDTVEEMTGDDDLALTSSEDDSQDLLQMAQEASVIKLVNEIILEAINERASDIHIEPFERLSGGLAVELPIAQDLCEVAGAAQQVVGDAWGAARSSRELKRGFFGDVHLQK